MDIKNSELTAKAETELLNFIIRVSQGEATSEKEVEVLPEVARLFFDFK